MLGVLSEYFSYSIPHAPFPESGDLDVGTTFSTAKKKKHLNWLIYSHMSFSIVRKIGKNFTQGRNLVWLMCVLLFSLKESQELITIFFLFVFVFLLQSIYIHIG